MIKSVKPKQRQNLWLILVAIGAIVILGAGLVVSGAIRFTNGPTQLAGATIDPPFPAPTFQLNDQFDQPISLASYKGKVVALTFIYTNCPDACPLITEKLHLAYDQLGTDNANLVILAVTVDPAHDTVAQVRNYSVQKDMLQKWHFLIGSDAEIRPVLAQYGVDAISEDDAAVAAKATAVALALPTPTSLSAKGVVDHASPTFIIDRLGRARAILDVNFAATDLVQNVRALLAE
jgi:protein SCO1